MRAVLKKLRSVLSCCALLLLAMLSTGCATTDVQEFQKLSPPEEEPLLRSGVAVRIAVIAGGKMDEQVQTVSPSGELALPFGAIKCQGMTLNELQTTLKAAYSKMILDPQVTAGFFLSPESKSPWGTALILGQVNSPGPVNIPQSRDLTIMRALQLAGGVTVFGDKSSIMVTRKLGDGKKLKLKLDLEEIAKKGEPERDIALHADDVVYVPESVW